MALPTVARSPLRVTVSVWKALFLREAAGRLFGERAGWFWLLLDPMFHVAYLMVIVLLFIVVNLVVDVLYSALDPRVRLGGSSA